MNCERCRKEAVGLMMSMFNTDMICNNCHLLETSHPDFERARQEEQDAISRGEYNFPGIGLPDDLKRKEPV